MKGNFLNGIIKGSSPALVAFGFLSFMVLGIYAIDYYVHINQSRFGYFASVAMAILGAAIIEGGRFSFLLASISDFAKGNARNGYLGLIASFFLVIHDLTVFHKIASLWSITDPMEYYSYFLFLVLFGLFVEVRLILAYNRTNSATTSNEARAESTPSANKVSTSETVGASAPVS